MFRLSLATGILLGSGMMINIVGSDPALGALEDVWLAQVQLGSIFPAFWRVNASDHTLGIGEVEHCHQMLFLMLGNLGGEKKANWRRHLLNTSQVYSSTRLVVTGHSLHHFMLGRCLHLLADFYFFTRGAYMCPH